jgi:hypothetical protein
MAITRRTIPLAAALAAANGTQLHRIEAQVGLNAREIRQRWATDATTRHVAPWVKREIERVLQVNIADREC